MILRRAAVLAQSGQLFNDISISMQRLLLGCLLGGLPAIVLGIVMGLSRLARASIEPLVLATYPLPKSALLPLILLVFGFGEFSKVLMVGLGVFYPVIINTTTGVLQIQRIYLDVGRNFDASRFQIFYTIALPGALPSILAGIKLGVGLGIILIAIAEMIGAQSGVGYMIWNAWQTMDIDTMYVGLLTIGVIGFVISYLLNEIETWLIPLKRASLEH
jgi:NitT/TauT family transport system permease protein